ncbi:HAMP domain-containing sensor histidine kinase [Actinoallomurus oryzae]|uniref:sensor histidine kinase n=1 Tax=Actinoallomurus oryzae TaxID=502180 RepID=UPI0031EFAD72
MKGPEESDGRSLARARWLLTAQLAGAITGVVLVVGALMFLTTTGGQQRDAQRDLRFYVARSSIESPPPCVWMFAQDRGSLRGTPSAPADLPVRSSMRRVANGGATLVERRRIGGIDYLIRTGRRGDMVVQAAMDLRYQQQERQRLYLALTVAELAGLLAALVTGQVLARRAISPLEEALRRQRRFVADASHELRTPLTRLHTRAQLLARRAATADIDKDLRTIVSDTRQFGEVIEDLLMSAQLGQATARRELVDLAAVVESVAEAESARAQARSIALEVRRDPGAYLVLGVPAALRRVVGALVDNALDHTTPGGHIELTLDRTGKRREVVLTVRDDGVGFDQAKERLIFERFKHGNAGDGRRFGLGLALVREVVDSHGGRVSATGEPGRGAAFTVRLPSVSVEAAAAR